MNPYEAYFQHMTNKTHEPFIPIFGLADRNYQLKSRIPIKEVDTSIKPIRFYNSKRTPIIFRLPLS